MSVDRLPTVSASQALHSLHARGARTVSTGVRQLDKLLAPPSLPGHDVSGGYMRGKVTEVFGPSGVGKTAFG
jgi:RecA/RadA recombinase